MFSNFKLQTITLSVAIFFLFGRAGFAQTPSEITQLSIELWPEYDRPEVLVIYQVELSEDIPLPASVTFNLPGYIGDMHAVAYSEGDSLLSVPQTEINLKRNGNTVQLSFPSPSREIHLEYYDSQILTTQNNDRLLTYNFAADHNIATANFRVQEPADAEDFSLNPPATRTDTGDNGQKLQIVETASMLPGDTFALTATYLRNTTAPVVPPPVQVITQEPAAFEIPSVSSAVGYILIGGGVLLLVGAAGYWWYPSKAKKAAVYDQPAASQPAPLKPVQVAPLPQNSSPEGEASTGYCYQCGTALRADSAFCHVCGAERRE